jgi:hypothetical protein
MPEESPRILVGINQTSSTFAGTRWRETSSTPSSRQIRTAGTMGEGTLNHAVPHKLRHEHWSCRTPTELVVVLRFIAALALLRLASTRAASARDSEPSHGGSVNSKLSSLGHVRVYEMLKWAKPFVAPCYNTGVLVDRRVTRLLKFRAFCSMHSGKRTKRMTELASMPQITLHRRESTLHKISFLCTGSFTPCLRPVPGSSTRGTGHWGLQNRWTLPSLFRQSL